MSLLHIPSFWINFINLFWITRFSFLYRKSLRKFCPGISHIFTIIPGQTKQLRCQGTFFKNEIIPGQKQQCPGTFRDFAQELSSYIQKFLGKNNIIFASSPFQILVCRCWYTTYLSDFNLKIRFKVNSWDNWFAKRVAVGQ